MTHRGFGALALAVGASAQLWLAAAQAAELGVYAVGAGPPDRFDTVVLDAGHGGEDEGALGRDGTVEKELVLDVVLRLRRALKKQGLNVVLTRDDDRYVALEERTAIANDARADLFLSIHANAAKAKSARGFETFYLSLEATDETAKRLAERENAAFSEATGSQWNPEDPLLSILGDMIATEQSHESNAFARLVEAEFKELRVGGSRGVKQAPFVVLMGLQMPASLLEIGFVTNPKDEASLRREAHRDHIVTAIAKAVEHFGRRYDARRGIAASAGEAGAHSEP